LTDFGVGKLNEGGRAPIPASAGTAQPVSQATSQPEKPKRGPAAGRKAKGRPPKNSFQLSPKKEADPQAARIRARSPSTSANPPPL